MMSDGLTYYLCAVNLAALVLYGIDKRRAKKGRWRISEAVLLGIAIAGGSAGAWIGMKAFHHKTKHQKFSFGVPLILVVQALVLMYFFF